MAIKSSDIDPAALEVPALYANRFQVTVLSDGLFRISFGEMLGRNSGVAYRASAMMTTRDARELATTILTLLGTTSARPS